MTGDLAEGLLARDRLQRHFRLEMVLESLPCSFKVEKPPGLLSFFRFSTLIHGLNFGVHYRACPSRGLLKLFLK